MGERTYNDNALDAARILATIQVFLGHFCTHYYAAPWVLNVVYFIRGVPILFALCGFLAAKSLDGQTAIHWLYRRGIRILPAFWVCILVSTGVIFLLYDVVPTARELLIYGVTQIFGMNFYTGDWLRGYGVGAPNGVLWTISVQIQFFLIAPLLYRWLKKMSLSLSMVFVLVLTGVSILSNNSAAFFPEILYKLVGVTVVPYLYFMFLGMVIWHFRAQIVSILEKRRWFILAGYCLWEVGRKIFTFSVYLDGYEYNTISTLLLVLCIFSFAFSRSWRMKHDYTYGFYLYHMVVMNAVIELGWDSIISLGQGVVLFSGIVCLSAICAIASYRCIERPSAKLLQRKFINKLL